jgi:hypothetical protein
MTVVWDVAHCSLVDTGPCIVGTDYLNTLIKEEITASETSASTYHTTRHNIHNTVVFNYNIT